MTSSLRNSIHRRNHKERSQLSHRSKLGLLEKHADYVKRARDYHSKQDRLNRLKQKVAERNKDEFYFSMSREKTKDGVHIKDRGNVALPTDIVKVLKTQDENYVRTMRASGLKKIDKIKNQLMEMVDLLKTDLHDLNDNEELEDHEIKILKDAKILHGVQNSQGRKRKHLVFAESSEEASCLLKNGKEKYSNDNVTGALSPSTDVDLGWKPTESKKKFRRKSDPPQANETFDTETSEAVAERTVEKRRRLLKELSARLDRDRQLRYAQREFEMQRQIMGKGGHKKILGVEKVEGGDEDDEENEDEIDARRGKRRPRPTHPVDEATYRPRVYKWRLERKR
ncbi:hypothetical protein GALMADRAFT_359023 [Galerina marginata CBS 339.88]|uniref:U3 small nucleolar RNA-associated protein 11 n=1 Tax=Galerina marginata (strain CBS 339.88) TaxID=685588 RepID=A0A067TZG1_GALM3|nr:hypothetical protein GALMADRAFT_359023 [Galerina marginata CBS 339.88]